MTSAGHSRPYPSRHHERKLWTIQDQNHLHVGFVKGLSVVHSLLVHIAVTPILLKKDGGDVWSPSILLLLKGDDNKMRLRDYKDYNKTRQKEKKRQKLVFVPVVEKRWNSNTSMSLRRVSPATAESLIKKSEYSMRFTILNVVVKHGFGIRCGTENTMIGRHLEWAERD